MKKYLGAILAILMIINSVTPNYGLNDNDLFIETDPINATYEGSDEGAIISENIQFNDMSGDHWALEAVSRLGALEIVKGYPSGNYGPNDTVSKEVVLTMLVRAMGLEADAITAADAIAAAALPEEGILDIWSRGYMQVASNMGLLTAIDLADALNADQTTLDPEVNFMRLEPVTREQVAVWVIQAMEFVAQGTMPPEYVLNDIYQYNDVEDITPSFGPYIESITSNRIMQGNNNNFNPKGELTRAELAQVLMNLDEKLFTAMGYTRHFGTVGKLNHFKTSGQSTTSKSTEILVRNEEGLVDKLRYLYHQDALGNEILKETPVLKNGVIVGLKSLEEKDDIEYIVENETGNVVYVSVKGSAVEASHFGQLQPLTDADELMITIESEETLTTYKMSTGIYNEVDKQLLISGLWYEMDQIPVGSYVTLKLQENLVTEIILETTPTLSLEISGIVKDVNSDFKYITIIDWDGKEITKNFVESNLIVEKQNYYDDEDEIGYIDEMFPDFRFDERDTTIDAVEVGDIVHLKLSNEDPMYVTALSAKTNYVVRFGTVKEINYYGAEGASIIVTYDDLSTGKYDISNDVIIKKQGKNIHSSAVEAGDTVRMLLNQAVLKPGTIHEEIKELIVDAYGSKIESVYRGSLGVLDRNQEMLSVINAYGLTKSGWVDYNQAMHLDVSKDVKYYYDGVMTTLNEIMNKHVIDDLVVYVATEDYYGKEVASMVSIRDGRDSVLDYSNITYANGFDTINLLSEANDIGVDPGTIVIKNDRLVEVGNIMSPDYAQIILNGGNQAAVVQIDDEPSNEATDLYRGRVASIDDNASFEVHSHAALKDNEWIYSPINRVFNIDNETKVVEEEEIVPISQFIDYSELSKVDEVYTIVAKGDYASHIIKNPYAKEAVSGELYSVDSAKIMIKDVLVYSSDNRNWTELSLTDSYAQIDLTANSVIIKNNEVIDYSQLEMGDKLKVMTTELLDEKLKLLDERNVPGYIVLVER